MSQKEDKQRVYTFISSLPSGTGTHICEISSKLGFQEQYTIYCIYELDVDGKISILKGNWVKIREKQGSLYVFRLTLFSSMIFILLSIISHLYFANIYSFYLMIYVIVGNVFNFSNCIISKGMQADIEIFSYVKSFILLLVSSLISPIIFPIQILMSLFKK